jgi:adenylate cyclase
MAIRPVALSCMTAVTTVIQTSNFHRARCMLAVDLHAAVGRAPIIVDTVESFSGRSLPGAVGLAESGWGTSVADPMQDRLRRKMAELTGGDRTRVIVAVGWSSERFGGRNLALRLVALGYTQVYWYRGGREAWEVAGLPEAPMVPSVW